MDREAVTVVAVVAWALQLARRLARHLGFRGAVLATIAEFDLVWGWSLLDPAAARPVSAAASYRAFIVAGRYLVGGRPLLPWAVALLVVGVLCGVQAWMDDDRPAFAAAMGVKVVMLLLTLAAWPEAGVQIVRNVVIWATLAMFVAVMSRLPPKQGV
jgi:hypothetical protein